MDSMTMTLTKQTAEDLLIERFPKKISESQKIVSFESRSGRQIALQRDVQGVQVWIEDDGRQLPEAITDARNYGAYEPRHSNLPKRLNYQSTGTVTPRPVQLVKISNTESLIDLIEWYDDDDMGIDLARLEPFKRAFLKRFPDFATIGCFSASLGEYYEAMRRDKDLLLAAMASRLEMLDESNRDSVGLELLRSVQQLSRFPCYATYYFFGDSRRQKVFDSMLQNDAAELAGATGLFLEEIKQPDSLSRFVDRIWPIVTRHEEKTPLALVRMIPTMIAALANPKGAFGLNHQPLFELNRTIRTGNNIGLYGYTNPFRSHEYDEVNRFASKLFHIMDKTWGWHPKDLWDVHNFVWVTRGAATIHDIAPTIEEETPDLIKDIIKMHPTNLILYGPPGTGKTYATAFEAVRLCDGQASGNRAAVMARYQELVDTNQIRFVTFHQSYSYEEFVEGLRPETDSEDESAGAGFSLRPHRGIFREHCAIADQGRLARQNMKDFDFSNRSFFKMSLGRSGSNDGIYDAAIEGGFISIGWGGNVDWSDDRYNDFNEIFKKWNEIEPGTNGNSGHISQVWQFRGVMKPGDIVIVSDGNSHFRAIGEISGDYVFDTTGASGYRHSRKVIWHKVLEQSLPVETVYSDNFTMRTCYRLKQDRVKKDALIQYLGGNVTDVGNVAPTQFVIIIDEINRANISKVFGELITLIEPDKRLGSENALQVRLPYSNELFGVPDNLHIIGTMNTADRSIALLDTALRRRFEFREIMPKPELLNPDLDGVNLHAVLRTINERIEYLFDREHQIGHAYFINCRSRGDIDQVMQHKVIPLLAEYFYEDWHKVAMVLGDANGEGRFIERKELKAPPGLDSYSESELRYRWQVRATFPESAYEAFQ